MVVRKNQQRLHPRQLPDTKGESEMKTPTTTGMESISNDQLFELYNSAVAHFIGGVPILLGYCIDESANDTDQSVMVFICDGYYSRICSESTADDVERELRKRKGGSKCP